jgi:hypothetical protein
VKVKWKKHYHIVDFMVQIFWRIVCGHMVCLHKFSWISEAICVLLISFYKKLKNAHSYPDKISGYPRRFIRKNIRIFDIRRISDILYSNSISEQNICIRICYPKKSGYPKILSEPVSTIFESGSGRIFSEPYYIPRSS